MGVVLVILIPNQHISILQFIVFTEQQITEKLYEEGLVWLYAFLGITIIGTYKGITEIPGIISEQFVIYIETTRTEIFDNKNSRCSRVSFTERMVLLRLEVLLQYAKPKPAHVYVALPHVRKPQSQYISVLQS